MATRPPADFRCPAAPAAQQPADWTPANFLVTVRGVPQQMCGFVSARYPVSVGILLDSSGSMHSRGFFGLEMAEAAIRLLLDQSGPQDEYFLEYVNDRPAICCGFTRDLARLRAVLQVPAKGRTPLLDSISLALEAMRKAQHETRVLIVFSDGDDNSSRQTIQDLNRQVSEMQIPLFLVMPDDMVHRLHPESDVPPARPALVNMAIESGGYAKSVTNRKDILAFMPILATAIRSVRVLQFAAPARTARTIGNVKVQVKGVGAHPELLYRRTVLLNPPAAP